jgi:HD-GYP domain-containing protein (c-di-GMP phosphodiesterase class II)
VIEADDTYTGTHSRNVLELSLAVADALGLDPETRREVEFTSLLHDIGKLHIPNSIIQKPGPLTAAERALIETHTIEGERILGQIGGFLGHVGSIVRACHERWDGGGYPDGLAGERIPVAARIVSCCDAYDAITSDRPYRRARSTAVALAELAAGSGSQFDPAVVGAVQAIVTRGADAPARLAA